MIQFQPVNYVERLAQRGQPMSQPMSTLQTLNRLSPQGDSSERISMLASLMAQAGSAAAPPAAEQGGADHDGHDHGGATPAAATPGGLPSWSIGGTPNAGTHTLGNWQSDLAYDFMGKGGDQVFAGVTGRVTRVSGQPGGDPRFAGYGITVNTPQGQLFYKHLGRSNVQVGARVTPQTVLGTLDPTVQGGAHLHLGASNRSLLDSLRRYYGLER